MAADLGRQQYWPILSPWGRLDGPAWPIPAPPCKPASPRVAAPTPFPLAAPSFLLSGYDPPSSSPLSCMGACSDVLCRINIHTKRIAAIMSAIVTNTKDDRSKLWIGPYQVAPSTIL